MKIAIAQLADGVSESLVQRLNLRTPTGPDGASVSAGESTREWAEVIDELLRLRRLEDDWDGQGAEAPAPEVVDTAIKVAADLRSAGMPPADRALAGVNGTIFFEWYDTKQYLEIEVFAPDHVEGRWVYPDSNTVEETTLTR